MISTETPAIPTSMSQMVGLFVGPQSESSKWSMMIDVLSRPPGMRARLSKVSEEEEFSDIVSLIFFAIYKK